MVYTYMEARLIGLGKGANADGFGMGHILYCPLLRDPRHRESSAKCRHQDETYEATDGGDEARWWECGKKEETILSHEQLLRNIL